MVERRGGEELRMQLCMRLLFRAHDLYVHTRYSEICATRLGIHGGNLVWGGAGGWGEYSFIYDGSESSELNLYVVFLNPSIKYRG